MAIQTINLGSTPTGAGGDTFRSTGTKVNENFTNNTHAASRLVGTAAGNVMEVGAFGLGASKEMYIEGGYKDIDTALKFTQFFKNNSDNTATIRFGSSIFMRNGTTAAILSMGYATPDFLVSVWYDAATSPIQYKLLNTANTTVDANGFIKNASPIVQLFADKIKANDEAAEQEPSFEKVDVGHYLVKNTQGFSDDGWYIEMPKDANGNVLVAVQYQQLEDNTIEVKTFAKKFDEETGDIVPNLEKPRDIPTGRWIDIRLKALLQPEIKISDTPIDFQPTNLAQAVSEALKDDAE